MQYFVLFSLIFVGCFYLTASGNAERGEAEPHMSQKASIDVPQDSSQMKFSKIKLSGDPLTYIVTPSFQKSEASFWSLVWENNVTYILLLFEATIVEYNDLSGINIPDFTISTDYCPDPLFNARDPFICYSLSYKKEEERKVYLVLKDNIPLEEDEEIVKKRSTPISSEDDPPRFFHHVEGTSVIVAGESAEIAYFILRETAFYRLEDDEVADPVSLLEEMQAQKDDLKPSKVQTDFISKLITKKRKLYPTEQNGRK